MWEVVVVGYQRINIYSSVPVNEPDLQKLFFKNGLQYQLWTLKLALTLALSATVVCNLTLRDPKVKY